MITILSYFGNETKPEDGDAISQVVSNHKLLLLVLVLHVVVLGVVVLGVVIPNLFLHFLVTPQDRKVVQYCSGSDGVPIIVCKLSAFY